MKKAAMTKSQLQLIAISLITFATILISFAWGTKYGRFSEQNKWSEVCNNRLEEVFKE